MVHTGVNRAAPYEVAEAIVRLGQLARELQELTGVNAPDLQVIALKATEVRENAGVVRSWAHLTNAGIDSSVAIRS